MRWISEPLISMTNSLL